MRGWQAAGAAPLVDGAPVANPETVASAIRIGNPASWHLAVDAAEQSGGRFRKVTDEQILAAQRELAARDGVFVEPASAAGVAGLLLEEAEGDDVSGRQVVVTVTGHGLKDIDTALSTFTDLVDTVVDADVEAAARAAGLLMTGFARRSGDRHGPGDERQPRPGLRQPRAGPRPARHAHRRGVRRAAHDRGHRRGCR